MMDEAVRLPLGRMIAATIALLRAHMRAVLLYVVSLAALGTAFDLAESLGASLVPNVVTVIAGYFLYEHLLRSEGLMAPGRTGRSVGTYLVTTLLTGFLTILALLLLILPGLILMARWSIASGLVVAEGLSTSQAMRASWAATRWSQWRIVLLYVLVGLVLGVPTILVGAGIDAAEIAGGTGELASLAITNLLAQILGAASLLIGVALISGLRPGADRLEAVFA